MVISNILVLFTPKNWGKLSIFDSYFSDGLVQPPTSWFIMGTDPYIPHDCYLLNFWFLKFTNSWPCPFGLAKDFLLHKKKNHTWDLGKKNRKQQKLEAFWMFAPELDNGKVVWKWQELQPRLGDQRPEVEGCFACFSWQSPPVVFTGLKKNSDGQQNTC